MILEGFKFLGCVYGKVKLFQYKDAVVVISDMNPPKIIKNGEMKELKTGETYHDT